MIIYEYSFLKMDWKRVEKNYTSRLCIDAFILFITIGVYILLYYHLPKDVKFDPSILIAIIVEIVLILVLYIEIKKADKYFYLLIKRMRAKTNQNTLIRELTGKVGRIEFDMWLEFALQIILLALGYYMNSIEKEKELRDVGFLVIYITSMFSLIKFIQNSMISRFGKKILMGLNNMDKENSLKRQDK